MTTHGFRLKLFIVLLNGIVCKIPVPKFYRFALFIRNRPTSSTAIHYIYKINIFIKIHKYTNARTQQVPIKCLGNQEREKERVRSPNKQPINEEWEKIGPQKSIPDRQKFRAQFLSRFRSLARSLGQ